MFLSAGLRLYRLTTVPSAKSTAGRAGWTSRDGVAFIERLCFDYLDMLGAPVRGPFVLTGGGAKSRYWCQLRADVLGSPVTLPENAEAALGMAVLAAAAAGILARTRRRSVS